MHVMGWIWKQHLPAEAYRSGCDASRNLPRAGRSQHSMVTAATLDHTEYLPPPTQGVTRAERPEDNETTRT
jgi:hypothetical protein